MGFKAPPSPNQSDSMCLGILGVSDSAALYLVFGYLSLSALWRGIRVEKHCIGNSFK